MLPFPVKVKPSPLLLIPSHHAESWKTIGRGMGALRHSLRGGSVVNHSDVVIDLRQHDAASCCEATITEWQTHPATRQPLRLQAPRTLVWPSDPTRTTPQHGLAWEDPPVAERLRSPAELAARNV